ncbi:MAG: hypothetical protein R3174_08250 [Gammaproteobacteria bacterium]|nr:hypothetical protein [Gammaproteobacteria bacterium]
MVLKDRLEDWIRSLYSAHGRRLREAIDEFADADPDDPGEQFTESLLKDAVRERAFDVQLEPYADGIRIRFRIDGLLLDALSTARESGEHLIRHLAMGRQAHPHGHRRENRVRDPFRYLSAKKNRL